MISLALVLVPAAAAVTAFSVRPDGPRRMILILTAVAHSGGTAVLVFSRRGRPPRRGWSRTPSGFCFWRSGAFSSWPRRSTR